MTPTTPSGTRTRSTRSPLGRTQPSIDLADRVGQGGHLAQAARHAAHPVLGQAQAVEGRLGQAGRLGPLEVGPVGRHQRRATPPRGGRRPAAARRRAPSRGARATTRAAARTRPASCSKRRARSSGQVTEAPGRRGGRRPGCGAPSTRPPRSRAHRGPGPWRRPRRRARRSRPRPRVGSRPVTPMTPAGEQRAPPLGQGRPRPLVDDEAARAPRAKAIHSLRAESRRSPGPEHRAHAGLAGQRRRQHAGSPGVGDHRLDPRPGGDLGRRQLRGHAAAAHAAARAAGQALELLVDLDDLLDERRLGVAPRVGGEQARRCRSAAPGARAPTRWATSARQPVVVAEADLLVGHGVVLVDDRHHAEVDAGGRSVPRACRYWVRCTKSSGASRTWPASRPCGSRPSCHRRMRRCWPTAETAWSTAGSEGRRSPASAAQPAAMAPEVTTTTRCARSRARRRPRSPAQAAVTVVGRDRGRRPDLDDARSLRPSPHGEGHGCRPVTSSPVARRPARASARSTPRRRSRRTTSASAPSSVRSESATARSAARPCTTQAPGARPLHGDTLGERAGGRRPRSRRPRPPRARASCDQRGRGAPTSAPTPDPVAAESTRSHTPSSSAPTSALVPTTSRGRSSSSGRYAPELGEQHAQLLRRRRPAGGGRAEVEQHHQDPGPLDVAQELVPEAPALGRALDQPRDVGHDELGAVVARRPPGRRRGAARAW